MGGDSNLGYALKEFLLNNQIEFISTTRNRKNTSNTNIYFNLENYSDFHIPKKIKIVYFCASITSNNICEKEKKLTRIINVKNTCEMIKKFLYLKIHVIYFSTNLIFSGNNKPSYHFSKFTPQNEYASQKISVENFLNNQNEKHFTIIRFGKIIFKNDNLLLDWIKRIKKNLHIKVAKNKFISPIYFNDAIDIIYQISFSKKFGTYQVSSFDNISYEEIAEIIIKIFKKNKKLIKFVDLNNVDNAILVSNINSYKKISSKETLNKFLLENNIS